MHQVENKLHCNTGIPAPVEIKLTSSSNKWLTDREEDSESSAAVTRAAGGRTILASLQQTQIFLIHTGFEVLLEV